jgi:hypothetical protein
MGMGGEGHVADIGFRCRVGLTAPLTALSQQLYGAAIPKGYGEDDNYGLIGALEVHEVIAFDLA